jgi:hypothetical protein
VCGNLGVYDGYLVVFNSSFVLARERMRYLMAIRWIRSRHAWVGIQGCSIIHIVW